MGSRVCAQTRRQPPLCAHRAGEPEGRGGRSGLVINSLFRAPHTGGGHLGSGQTRRTPAPPGSGQRRVQTEAGFGPGRWSRGRNCATRLARPAPPRVWEAAHSRGWGGSPATASLHVGSAASNLPPRPGAFRSGRRVAIRVWNGLSWGRWAGVGGPWKEDWQEGTHEQELPARLTGQDSC